VVEQPLDIVAIDRAAAFKGRYHVLHGSLNPMEGIGPEQIHVRELLARVQSGEVREIIMATNPSLEGEATAMYVHRLLSPLGVRVTRLARGLPSGADLEYTDDVTLARALEGRQDL
jgi:recombination protein RecR